MGIFNDILKSNIENKIEQFLNNVKNRKMFNDLKNELDKYLIENYGNEEYYDSLYRYIHNGKVSQSTYSNEMSAFYYTLFCAFLSSDDIFLGEHRFYEYHLSKIQKSYPNDKYDKNNIKKCFSHFYNTFKSEFGSPSEINRASVNSMKDTTITTGDRVIDALSNESAVIKETMKEGFAQICKQRNVEKDIQSEKDNSLLDKICDDNNEYQERLQDPLFLESDIDDNQKATLADVYTRPHFNVGFYDLKQWAKSRDSRILLLYGKAGIGKTSYISWLSLNNGLTHDCHILELRKCINILDSNNPWESIKKSFMCMNNSKYKNKVLILDGLDEVCVLKSEFNGHEFIKNLRNTLKSGFGRNIRIIITSRMGYFNEINISNHIDVATIFWEKDSITDWCDAYCKIHRNRAEWCESFKKTYSNLKNYDKRKEVFCTPLILYICCVSKVDISKHDSVASIYDDAFNVIGTRRYNEWTEVSKEEFEINRQFTKELAFQMFLNDKLEDVLGSEFIQIAKEKVVDYIQKKHLSQVKELEFQKLFAINHFAYDKDNAIEFAHKTIGEYFTAVKLYEDYFEDILDGTVENTWHNIFNDFRYKTIPLDIMQYLIDLILIRKDNKWIENFFKAYYIGMDKQLLLAVVYFISEYSTSCSALINQIHISFRNLTWLLTGLGFDNSKYINTKENLEILASCFHGDVNISGWKNLDNINLSHSYLDGARFKKASLKNANFTFAVLSKTDFNEAILEKAEFMNADLLNANLSGADLSGANLSGAYLKGADLRKANLKEAYAKYANLIRVNLEEAYVKYANLIQTRFIDACLINVDLTQADLTGADLTGANLTEANLTEANLKKVYVKHANFTQADLKGAYLAHVNLTQTDCEGASFIQATLTGANLTRSNFTQATFTGANLIGAHLAYANITKADFAEADLKKADFTKAIRR